MVAAQVLMAKAHMAQSQKADADEVLAHDMRRGGRVVLRDLFERVHVDDFPS